MVIYCQLFIVPIGKRVNVVVSVTHQQRKALDGGSKVQVVAGATSLFRVPLGSSQVCLIILLIVLPLN